MWLKVSSGLIVVTALFSLVLGLDIWFLTLKTKEDFAPLWSAQNATVQELMQTAVRFLSTHPPSGPLFYTTPRYTPLR